MWKVALILVAAAPLLVQSFPSEDVKSEDLAMEHRTVEDVRIDMVPKLPAATDDMFIWHGPNGTYRFGLQTPDQWRVETRDREGNVKGRYSYRTPEGEMIEVSYTSGADGYKAEGAAIPGDSAGQAAQAMEKSSLQAEKFTLEVEDKPSPEIEQAQAQEDEDVIPYGALRKAGERLTLPNGPGVYTVEDDNIQVIVTEVKGPERLFSLREEPLAPEDEVPLVDQDPFAPEGQSSSPPIAFFPVFPGQTPEGKPVMVVGAPHISFGPAVVRPVSSGVIEA